MKEEMLKVLIGAPLGLAAFLIGDFDIMILTLLALAVVDFGSGILNAIYRKNVDSRVMFWGGIKKVGILMVVAVANMIDKALGLGGALRSMVIGYYMANEGISILENWGGLGLPLPAGLRDVLAQLRDHGGEGEKENNRL